jgi:hypothetical protein
LVSLVDLTPTILDLAGVPVPADLDGKSLIPFLENRTPETWREAIVFLRNEDIYYGLARRYKDYPGLISKLEAQGWEPRPDHHTNGTYSRDKEIRCYYDGQYGYIFNGCYQKSGVEMDSLGTIVPYTDASLDAMRRASADDDSIRERYEFYLQRAPEEIYDWSADPGSWKNLAGNPEYSRVLNAARKGLLEWMQSSNDPLAAVYEDFVDSQ